MKNCPINISSCLKKSKHVKIKSDLFYSLKRAHNKTLDRQFQFLIAHLEPFTITFLDAPNKILTDKTTNLQQRLLNEATIIFLMSALIPAGNYMFKFNIRNTRARCETCSKLTIKTPQRRNLQS